MLLGAWFVSFDGRLSRIRAKALTIKSCAGEEFIQRS